VTKVVGNGGVARRFIDVTGPLGAGVQTSPTDTLIGITEGYKGILGDEGSAVITGRRRSSIVPLIFKDFVVHWRDLEESRLTGAGIPVAEAAGAAAACALREDRLVLLGDKPLGRRGLMTAEGRLTLSGLNWDSPGDAFANFTRMIALLGSRGHTGPFAAVVHPAIYTGMHKVVEGSALLEIQHVKSLCAGGVFRSSLLARGSGLVVSAGKQNLDLVVSLDTSIAFLGARRLNLPFRVLKAVCLRILRSDSICTFEPE
jgi:uncharacterized linocin/CFP29 family protein